MTTATLPAAPTVNGAVPTVLSLLDVLTLSQAAEYLQLPEHVIRSEAEAGRLTGRWIHGEWRFLRENIVAWLRTPSWRTAAPVSDETPEEQAAFLEALRAQREELDRATGFGKYAPE